MIFVAAAHVEWNTWGSVRSKYKEFAEFIDRDAASMHPKVAAGEFGTIGYFSRADMVDYLGLLDRRAIDFVRRNDFTWWLSAKPDYWVTPKDWSVDAPTLALSQFQHDYSRVAVIGQLTVYRRVTR